MCGRYTLFETKKLVKRFNLATQPDVKASYNIAPGQHMPVVVRTSTVNEVEYMRWGFLPIWAKDASMGYRLINARAESIFDKSIWKSAALHSHCLVPSNGFYEWKLENKIKQPYFIKPKDQDIFAFAGIFSTWKDAQNNTLKTFAIITTRPNKQMASIHDRMPVILKPEQETAWLESSEDGQGAIESLLNPYEDGLLEIYKISSDVNNPRHNSRNLLQRIET